MTVATLKEVLAQATQQKNAVAGLVVLGWEDAVAFVAAAEEARQPIVLQAGPGCRAHTPIRVLASMFRTLMEQARVPVVAHLDHAYTIDECKAGIDCGFTSVMFDGSSLPISKNIKITNEICKLAEPSGVSVEGEVGIVGYADGKPSANTDPREAQLFDLESGADALAISVGNVHLNTAQITGIDFGVLAGIEAATRLPLVLHGGSGIPGDVRRRLAHETRVKKFNIGTEIRMAFGSALRGVLRDDPALFDRIQIMRRVAPDVQAATLAILRELA
jgi:fructose-bisphosphate aldolase, class II